MNSVNYSAVQKWWTNYSFHALTARTLMDNILGLCCQMHKGRSIKRYFQSRHCFADSCELEWTIVWRCVVDRTWLVCHTHTTLWAWRVRHACGLGVNSQNSFNKILKKISICKSLYSRNFAMWYSFGGNTRTHVVSNSHRMLSINVLAVRAWKL